MDSTKNKVITSDMSRARNHQAWAALLFAATLWGTNGIVFKQLGFLNIDAYSISFWRLALSVPFLWIMSRVFSGKWCLPVTRKSIMILLILGGSMALYQLTYVLAIEKIGVAFSVLISICLAPLFVAVIEVMFFKKTLKLMTVVALGLGVLGTALLVNVPSDTLITPENLVTGMLLAVVCALFQALYVLSAHASSQVCNPMYAGAVAFAFGALLLLPFSNWVLAQTFSPHIWILLLYVASVPTALAQTLFITGVKIVGPIGAAIASLIEPLIASILAMLFLNESMTWLGFIGAGLLLASLICMQFRPAAN